MSMDISTVLAARKSMRWNDMKDRPFYDTRETLYDGSAYVPLEIGSSGGAGGTIYMFGALMTMLITESSAELRYGTEYKVVFDGEEYFLKPKVDSDMLYIGNLGAMSVDLFDNEAEDTGEPFMYCIVETDGVFGKELAFHKKVREFSIDGVETYLESSNGHGNMFSPTSPMYDDHSIYIPGSLAAGTKYTFKIGNKKFEKQMVVNGNKKYFGNGAIVINDMYDTTKQVPIIDGAADTGECFCIVDQGVESSNGHRWKAYVDLARLLSTIEISITTGELKKIDPEWLPEDDGGSGGIPVVTTEGDLTRYTVTIPGITELYNGLTIAVMFHDENTSPVYNGLKLNVNGLGDVDVYMLVHGATFYKVAIPFGWIRTDIAYILTYNYGNWLTATNTRIYVGAGGTGQTSLTSGSYLVGNGTNPVKMKTPAQVLADILPSTAEDVGKIPMVQEDGTVALATPTFDEIKLMSPSGTIWTVTVGDDGTLSVVS